MKVLQVNCVYRTGSTGKITADLHQALKEKGVSAVVCYGRGSRRAPEQGVYRIAGESYAKWNHLLANITGVMYGGCLLSTARLLHIIRKEKPDVVHLQCINGYFVNIYRLIAWLRDHHIKTVLTLHAEFMYTANCGHALECDQYHSGCEHCPRWRQETGSLFFDRTARSFRKMQAAFAGFFDDLLVTSVSPWLMDRALSSPILAGKQHKVIFNGLDTGVFFPRNCEEQKKKLELQGKKILFHATPYFSGDPQHIKGGYYVIELARRLLPQNVTVLVAGNYAPDLNLPANIRLLGNIRDQDRLAELYSMADATVIASKRETFSMVCAESLCCGTPVVGFVAGAPEQIALPRYSTFCPYGDMEALVCAVSDRIRQGKEAVASLAQEAKERYSRDRMVEEYLSAYHALITKKDNP